MRPDEPTIRIVHNLARVGGTIICRCLGCMEGVVLLSEIHPLTRETFDPVDQAREWFGIEVQKSGDFVEDLLAIEQQARIVGKLLVIRSWDHVNFMWGPAGGPDPCYRSRLAGLLAGHYHLRRIALVREPEPQWRSLLKFCVADMPEGFTQQDFLRGHRLFGEMARKIGCVRYEDFLVEPALALLTICAALDVPFDIGFASKWQNYRIITGDIEAQVNRITICQSS